MPQFTENTLSQIRRIDHPAGGDWGNSSIIGVNVVKEVAWLKHQPDKNIGVSGSGTLVQSLLRHNLINEQNLLVYPAVLGRGKRLFEHGLNPTLKLMQSITSSSGILATASSPEHDFLPHREKSRHRWHAPFQNMSRVA